MLLQTWKVGGEQWEIVMIMKCVSVGGADTSDNMSAGPTQIPAERDRRDTAFQWLLLRTLSAT